MHIRELLRLKVVEDLHITLGLSQTMTRHSTLALPSWTDMQLILTIQGGLLSIDRGLTTLEQQQVRVADTRVTRKGSKFLKAKQEIILRQSNGIGL